MKIAVFDYVHGDVNFHVVDKAYLDTNYNGDINEFLRVDQGYRTDEISWMAGINSINIIDSDSLNQISI